MPAAAPTSFAAFARTHTRTSLNDWTTMLLDAVEPDVWTLVIDDLTDITVHGVRLLDRLATRFTIAAATRRIRPPLAPHFARFDRIEVRNLSVADACRLIRQASAGAQVEDPRLLESHLWQQTGGNPRAILESVARLRREPEVTRNAVRRLEHSEALPQIDLTPLVIVPLLFIVGFRYIARGLGDRELYLFAGVASVMAMVALYLLRRINR